MGEEHLSVNISQKALIIINTSLLLVRENSGWELPGGRVNKEETSLMDALKRELREELSVEISPKKIYHASIFQNKTGKKMLVLVYECELVSPVESIQALDKDILEWKLFSKDELTRLSNIYPNSIDTIEKYLQQ